MATATQLTQAAYSSVVQDDNEIPRESQDDSDFGGTKIDIDMDNLNQDGLNLDLDFGESQFHKLIKEDKYEDLLEILSKNCFVDIKNYRGQTPLAYLIDKDITLEKHEKVFNALRKCSNIHKKDRDGKSPLSLLAFKSIKSTDHHAFLNKILEEIEVISNDECQNIKHCIGFSTWENNYESILSISDEEMQEKSKKFEEKLFRDYFEEFSQSKEACDYEKLLQLLQWTCQEGLPEATRQVIKIFQKFDFENEEIKTFKHEDIPKLLIALFKFLYKSKYHNLDDVMQSYKIVMELEPDINYLYYTEEIKEDGYFCIKQFCNRIFCKSDLEPKKTLAINFLLADAIKYGVTPIVDDFLSGGASLTSFKESKIVGIERYAQIIKKNMDKAIKYNEEKEPRSEIMYDFSLLLPPVQRLPSTAKSSELPKFGYDVSEDFGDCDCKTVMYFRKSASLKHLLAHPLVDSFLCVRWECLKWFFYLNTVMLIFFGISMASFGINIFQYRNEQSYLMFIFISTTAIMCIRELYQLFGRGLRYFTDIENYLVPIILAISIYLILNYQKPEQRRLIKQLCMINYLLTGIELLLTLAQFPYMSKYIAILRKVTWNFFKILTFYLIIIMSFALCFILLFLNRGLTRRAIFNAIFNTTLMIPGQLDPGELNFDKYPYTSHTIFMVFVMLISVVMFNLMNALAVSDATALNKIAPIWENAARVDFIYSFENLVVDKNKSYFSRFVTICIKFVGNILHIYDYRFNANVMQYTDNKGNTKNYAKYDRKICVNVNDKKIKVFRKYTADLKSTVVIKTERLLDQIDNQKDKF